ncbi:MAG: NAD-dependent epimerase/dehydratase family protein [Alphaproteobacteria bacterium]|nr:NAD-dependent epimerase/dehydratase family protein [Alphaproteobacteria bacterium]
MRDHTNRRRALLSALGAVLGTSAPAVAHGPGEASDLTIAVVGATSRTADELIPQALWRGHKVIAIARRPHAVRFQSHPRLRLVEADVENVASVTAALKGEGDAIVVSVFGAREDPQAEVPQSTLMTNGVRNILQAMRTNGNRKIITVSSASVQEMPKFGYTANTPRPENLTIRTGLWYYLKRGLYNDMAEMERVARDSGLTYINLRPGLILTEPARGNIKTASNVDAPGQRVITYADFAAFILDAAESSTYDNATVGVYSDRPIEFNDQGLNPEAMMARQREINRKIREEVAGRKR